MEETGKGRMKYEWIFSRRNLRNINAEFLYILFYFRTRFKLMVFIIFSISFFFERKVLRHFRHWYRFRNGAAHAAFEMGNRRTRWQIHLYSARWKSYDYVRAVRRDVERRDPCSSKIYSVYISSIYIYIHIFILLTLETLKILFGLKKLINFIISIFLEILIIS